jgi:hypothetical protein
MFGSGWSASQQLLLTPHGLLTLLAADLSLGLRILTATHIANQTLLNHSLLERPHGGVQILESLLSVVSGLDLYSQTPLLNVTTITVKMCSHVESPSCVTKPLYLYGASSSIYG